MRPATAPQACLTVSLVRLPRLSSAAAVVQKKRAPSRSDRLGALGWVVLGGRELNRLQVQFHLRVDEAAADAQHAITKD